MQRISRHFFLGLTLLISLISSAFAAASEQKGYIVVFNETVASPPAVAREIARQVGGNVGFIYEHALKGFSITVPPQALAALEKNPRIKYVATDDVRYAFERTIPTGIQRIFASSNTNIDIDGNDDFRVDVDVAVIDTGIDFQHPDLNVVGGINCVSLNPFKAKCVEGGDDDHYHGTHVAGSIGALDNGFGVVGVAPGARLWAVKVLDSNGFGYSSGIIAGIDWVAANAGTIEVANMSLGGAGYSQAEYDAIQGAVNQGVAFAVAAGNDADNAGNYSPAAFNNVLTVSALADFDGQPGKLGEATCRTDQDDTLADFSNWGSAVDIAAPGVCILSTFPLEQGEYGTISGTSMASPHAAGALALLASVNPPTNAEEVYGLYDQVIKTGNFDWDDDSGDGHKEPLLDVSTFIPVLIPGSETGTPTNNPPTVDITTPENGATFASGTSISFAGMANDQEDGDLTGNLIWESDGAQIGTGGSFNASLSDGTHTITASVADSQSAIGTDSVAITVSVVPNVNTPPSVSINSPADGAVFNSGASITFQGTATDPEDGDITGNLIWESDDVTIDTGGIVSTSLSDGVHTVTASVTDSDGAADSAGVTITVNPVNNGEFSLVVTPSQIKSNKYVDLKWSGATSANVDVYRDGTSVITTANDGEYTDKPNKFLTSVTYRVCEAGTEVCSNTATATW